MSINHGRYLFIIVSCIHSWEVKSMACKKNDQRSDVKNPNNPAQKSNVDNRSNQMNPNNTKTKGK